jgi:hypothetical protein
METSESTDARAIQGVKCQTGWRIDHAAPDDKA